MKFKNLIIIVLLFCFALSLSLGIVSSADYGDIRDQVNSASSGDTINLGSGTYNI